MTNARSRCLVRLVVLGLLGGTSVRAQDPVQYGLHLSEDELKAVAGRVRAGRSLQPASWPDGARVAVALSFDVDNDTITIRRGNPSIGAMSQGEYGARVGLRRVVDLMDRHEIPASFFIPAVSLILAPDMVDVIQASGRHEFGVHGWIHELNTALDAETERELVRRALGYLEQATGTRPVGYRAPSWNFSPNTLSIIRGLGFLYDSSLMSDDRPYELLADGEPTGMSPRSPCEGRSWARRSTWPRSKRAGRTSTSAPISTASASRSSRCSRARSPSSTRSSRGSCRS